MKREDVILKVVVGVQYPLKKCLKFYWQIYSSDKAVNLKYYYRTCRKWYKCIQFNIIRVSTLL
jgi:hypothetical protein